jgi:hypothetical protein
MKDYIRLNIHDKNDPDQYVNKAAYKFTEHRSIIKAIPSKIVVEKSNLRHQIADDFSKDVLQQARELLDEGLIRSAGTFAGVALARHLQLECDEGEVEYEYDDGISSLAHPLYETDEIRETTLSNLETLGQIRNDCAHANQTEPCEHRVRKFIDDTDDYIRGRGI